MQASDAVVVVVEGNDDQHYLCISSVVRPFLSHSWIRAAVHIPRMNDVPYLTRLEAISDCLLKAEAISLEYGIQRIEPVPGFTW